MSSRALCLKAAKGRPGMVFCDVLWQNSGITFVHAYWQSTSTFTANELYQVDWSLTRECNIWESLRADFLWAAVRGKFPAILTQNTQRFRSGGSAYSNCFPVEVIW